MSDLTDNYFYPSAERIWLCIRLNNAGKHCDITLKIMVMLQNVAYGFWKKISTVSSVCSLSCESESEKNLASSSINQSVKSQKQCAYLRILLLWQKVCVNRHQHQFTVVLNNWTFRRHHWDEFYWVWCHTKFNWFRSWNQLTIQCVFASLSGPAIDLQKMPILTKKKIIFSNEAHFDLGGYVYKQNSRIWGTENPHTYIENRRTQNELLFGADFGPKAWLGHFSSKMSKERPLQSTAISSGPCWTNFCSQKLNRILATFRINRTALRATQPNLHSMFCALFLNMALSAA